MIRRCQAYEGCGLLDLALADISSVLALGKDSVGVKVYNIATQLQSRIRSVKEEINGPIHLLRKASVDEVSGAMCFCLDPVSTPEDGVRLRCRCILHEHCMVAYVRSKLEDRTSVSDRGIPCPYACGNHVWIDDVDALSRIHTVRSSRFLLSYGMEPLTPSEAAKFRLWVISASFARDELVCCPVCNTPHWVDRGDVDEPEGGSLGGGRGVRVICSNTSCRKRFCSSCQVEWHVGMTCVDYQRQRADAQYTSDLIHGSAKNCPNCQSPVTHYHGHACHHIRGCPGCGTHFCYRCLSTEEQNIRGRGERSRCLCEEGRWATYCIDDDILTYLALDPVPHDTRCGCPICPDCRRDAPCAGCNGDCLVCVGTLPPGPTSLSDHKRYRSITVEPQQNGYAHPPATVTVPEGTVVMNSTSSLHSLSTEISSGHNLMSEETRVESSACREYTLSRESSLGSPGEVTDTGEGVGDQEEGVVKRRYLARCFKEEGNALFQKRRYQDAVLRFTSAIALFDKDVTLFSNRR